jgi:hypothetical protein
MIVIVFDAEADWDMTIVLCGSYWTRQITDKDNMQDVIFENAVTMINHNAGIGMSGGFNIPSPWELYVRKDAEITTYDNEMEGKRAFFELLIDDGYGGDERNFLNDFFNDYADAEGGNLDLLEWILR